MAITETSDREAASEAINNLLSAFWLNGQVCGKEWPIALYPDRYVATVLIPEKSSLEAAHHNCWVWEQLQKLDHAGLAPPKVKIAEDLFSERSCVCERPPSYILYTTFLSYEPPLRCGHCFLPIALYRVPALRGEEYQDILSWQAYYQAYDTLQMGSGPMEALAREQVAQLNSDLSQSGLAICRDLRAATQAPVYYYLHRTGALSREQEQRRLCPSCHEEWLLPTPWHLFDFRCERCALVSNIAGDAP